MIALGLPLIDKPLIDLKRGACHVCGRPGEILVTNLSHGEPAGESCRECSEKLGLGVLRMPVRIRQASGVDGVAEARLTTDPE